MTLECCGGLPLAEPRLLVRDESDAVEPEENGARKPAGVDDGDQEPAWVDVAAKLFVVCAVCAVARVARDDLSWPGMATAAALAAAAYALRGETLGDNEHPKTF